MAFSDFVESIIEIPICCELKQHLDKLYEFYIKYPEKCVSYLGSLSRGSAKNDWLILLPLLLETYSGLEDFASCAPMVLKEKLDEAKVSYRYFMKKNFEIDESEE